MALTADHSGYPGPKHLLEWKTKLKLTPEQQAAMENLFVRMREQALARGKEVLLAERRHEDPDQHDIRHRFPPDLTVPVIPLLRKSAFSLHCPWQSARSSARVRLFGLYPEVMGTAPEDQ